MWIAYLHLYIQYVPLICLAIGFILFCIAYILENNSVKQIALALFVLVAISTYVFLRSGEGSPNLIKEIRGIDYKLIHEHENKAANLQGLLYLLGLVSLIGLWAQLKNKNYYKTICLIAICLSALAISGGFFLKY